MVEHGSISAFEKSENIAAIFGTTTKKKKIDFTPSKLAKITSRYTPQQSQQQVRRTRFSEEA